MLEEVAKRYTKKNKKPLVLILNNIQYFQNNDEGRDLLLQFQQRAEEWSPSGNVVVCFKTILLMSMYL